MAKIELDKYYTPKDVAKYCIDKTFDILKDEDITEIIEPSAGNGNFSLQIKDCIAYDIEPEHGSITEKDFLQYYLPYKKGRLFIGNPPFGERMEQATRFYLKCISEGDYVAFILPISQFQNVSSLYQFDLVHSERLGEVDYSGRPLKCCFNIYKRNKTGEFNKRKVLRLKDIKIVRQDSKRYEETRDFDVRMCYWGNGSAGKILTGNERYSAEYKIIVKNPKYKEKVREVLENVNWWDEIESISKLKIQQFHILKVLKREIPELE